jgi:hypothetical protein
MTVHRWRAPLRAVRWIANRPIGHHNKRDQALPAAG